MIATCTKCQARYQLEDDKIPARMIKVRCPACQGVFALDGTLARVEEPPAMEISTFEPSVNDAPETPVAAQTIPEPVVEAPVAAPAAVVDSSPTPVVTQSAPEAAPAASAVATLDEPAAVSTGTSRRRRCKEEMLARALVSDILVYNRDTRDAGLEEGNLLEALGGEIKKSWELYKEKVTPEVANSTTYFREALNDILADGDQVF